MRKPNPIARSLKLRQFKTKIVKPKKGKGSYRRKSRSLPFFVYKKRGQHLRFTSLHWPLYYGQQGNFSAPTCYLPNSKTFIKNTLHRRLFRLHG
jgi:stalled ribosome alternative rescue factor ArfA